MELIRSAAPAPEGGTPRVAAILDTNVVLDWLVFDDPAGRALGAQVEAGQLRWLVCSRMLEELQDVLGRLEREPHLLRWAHRRERAWEAAQRWASLVDEPTALPPALPLRSSDPDDQVFVDLAVGRRVGWLFSRDRAILRLARRLRPLGVRALSPAVWLAGQADPAR